jgi:hypothetical protein
MANAWIEHVREYRKKHPELTYPEALKAARDSYHKKKMRGGFGSGSIRGGFNNIDLVNPQLRYEAGVSALNSGLADMGRAIRFN